MSKSYHEHAADPREVLGKAEARRAEARAGYIEILNQRDNKLSALKDTSGPRSKSYRDAERRLQKSETEYERIKTAVRRPLNKWHVRGAIILTVGVVLALLEAPVNKFLFDVALQSSSFASYTISIMFAAALLILAHICGRSLRQIWSEFRRRIVWSSLLIFALTIVVLFALVGILTVARASFAASAGSIEDLFQGVRSAVGSLGLWGTLVNAFSEMSALVLATINIGGIFVTMMLAFFTHDPDKDFDHIARALEADQKVLDKIHRQYIQERTGIIKDMATDLAGFSANFRSANAGVIEYKRRLGEPLTAAESEVIDELDQMSENADRAEAEEWKPPERERPAPPDGALPGEASVYPIDRAKKPAAG